SDLRFPLQVPKWIEQSHLTTEQNSCPIRELHRRAVLRPKAARRWRASPRLKATRRQTTALHSTKEHRATKLLHQTEALRLTTALRSKGARRQTAKLPSRIYPDISESNCYR